MRVWPVRVVVRQFEGEIFITTTHHQAAGSFASFTAIGGNLHIDDYVVQTPHGPELRSGVATGLLNGSLQLNLRVSA